MLRIQSSPKQKCRLLAVLCGKVANRQSKMAKHLPAYPLPKFVSSGCLEIQTLTNPTLNRFCDAHILFGPNFLFLQGELLEEDEEIGSLVWGTVNVADPQMLCSLIGSTLPNTVYLEVPNSESIAQALHSKGVPYVIYWKDSFSSNAAFHFRQALLSVLQSSYSHTWDAFQLAHASFRLCCVRNDHVLPVNRKNTRGMLGPCLLGDAPKIDITLPEKASGEEENLSDVLPAIKINDDDVSVRFLVCGVPRTLDACLLGSFEDGLSALLNIEIRGSKLFYRVSATPPPLQDGVPSHGAVQTRCDLITGSSARVSLLVSGSVQSFSNDQLGCHIKNELIEKSHLVRALPSREESKPPFFEPLNSVSIACGASMYEVCMKVPNWAAQVLKQLAPAVSYRGFATLGIASVQGIPVGSFEKDDAERLFFLCARRGKDLCEQDGFLFTLPVWSSSVTRKRSRLRLQTGLVNRSNMASENGATRPKFDQGVRLIEGSRMPFVSDGRRLKAAAMRPVPHSRQRRKSCSKLKPKVPIKTPAKHNSVPPTPATHAKSMSSSSRARQIVPLNPSPAEKHGCKRSQIELCSEEEFLSDVVRFLVLRGHSCLVPQGGISEFPDAVLNGKQLDLYNLYREVVSRGGFHVGNGINWKGQVFSKMRNHTAINRMTGVTNALKKHYETYLLEYELAHDDVGGECCCLCHSGDPGGWVNCGFCGEWAHFSCDGRQGLGAFKDYAKTNGLEYICPYCSLTICKRKL